MSTLSKAFGMYLPPVVLQLVHSSAGRTTPFAIVSFTAIQLRLEHLGHTLCLSNHLARSVVMVQVIPNDFCGSFTKLFLN